MIKAAVLGSPIGHSLSPALHKRAYEILDIPASYGAIELTPDRAKEFFERALDEDWTGFSLTMPLKESIFDLNFTIDPIAERMRSANTLVRKGNTFYATSTDRTGFIRLFDGVDKKRVAIIGGGGTARAALSALDGTAGSIDFLLRSPSRADLLSTIADQSEINFFDMKHSLRGYDLVISTVPTGASDSIASLLDFKIPTLCEVLYKPYPTRLLAKAQSFGTHTIDGIDLLVEQALDQVLLFTGKVFDLMSMRIALQSIGRSHLQ
ncbi:MAG: shikimate dehydrogenase [Actinomycetota bacterium]